MAKGSKEIAVTLEALLSGEVSEEQVNSLTFEQALRLLEEVVTSVESGSLPSIGPSVLMNTGPRLLSTCASCSPGLKRSCVF